MLYATIAHQQLGEPRRRVAQSKPESETTVVDNEAPMTDDKTPMLESETTVVAGNTPETENQSAFEAIEFDGVKIPIRRLDTHELYIALQPPDALPYITAPRDQKPEEILAFVMHWIDTIRDLRTDMLKHFEKTKSLKCRYQTGDIAYLFGRPFMLKVYPLASGKGKKISARGRANVSAAIRQEVSVIDMFLIKAGDYDQGRAAFLSLAKPIFARNVQSLVAQCMARVFPDSPLPANVGVRPLRTGWVYLDTAKDTVWISESLIPYPPECVVYAFLIEMIKALAPEASEAERQDLLVRGLPNWQELRAVLNDPNSIYANQ